MKRILMSALAIGAVVASIGGATLAWFSDSESSNENTFSAGTLSLDENGVNGNIDISLTNMAPGDVSKDFVVTIKNTGSVDMAWIGDWEFTGSSLKDVMYVDYASMEFVSPDGKCWLDEGKLGGKAGYTRLAGDRCVDEFIVDGKNNGPYAAFLPFNPLATLTKFEDNNSMIPGSTYEHMGALKQDYSYKLTIRFGLDQNAGNSYQGLGPVRANFKVDATQVKAGALEALYPGLSSQLSWFETHIADQANN